MLTDQETQIYNQCMCACVCAGVCAGVCACVEGGQLGLTKYSKKERGEKPSSYFEKHCIMYFKVGKCVQN